MESNPCVNVALWQRPHLSYRHTNARERLGTDYFLPNIAISITQRTLYKLVFSIIEAAVGKPVAPGYFDRLLACCETKIGFVNKELYCLASRIARR